MTEKHSCDCGKKALWWYAPATNNDTTNRHFCDECVPRSCSCNYRYVDVNAYSPPLDAPDMPTIADEPYVWIEPNSIWVHVDERGRQHPCVEFWYDIDGYDVDI